MQFGRAVIWITITSTLFGIIGALIGYLIGSKMPSYYRSVFEGGDLPHFDPVAVGFGQGLTQGITLGVTIGLALVLASWWKESRLAAIALEEKSLQPRDSTVSAVDSEVRLRA